jgi:hypothetical protein
VKKFFLTLALLLALLAAAGWILLLRFENRQLYQPTAALDATPAQFQLRYQDVQFSAPTARRCSAGGFPRNRPRGTVVYCHGKRGQHRRAAPSSRPNSPSAASICSCGTIAATAAAAAGRPKKGLYADARAAFDAAEAMSRKLPVIAYGHSSAPPSPSSSPRNRPLAGLVVQGGFASLADMAKRRYPALPPRPRPDREVRRRRRRGRADEPAEALRPQPGRRRRALPERPHPPRRRRRSQDVRPAFRRAQRHFLVRPRRPPTAELEAFLAAFKP